MDQHDLTADGLTRRDLLRRAALSAGAVAAGTALPAGAAEALTTAAGGLPAAAADAPQVLMLAKVWATPATAAVVGELDDTHVVFDDGAIEVLLWPGDLARLQAAGVRHEITVPDLIARDTAELARAAAAPAQERTLPLQPGERSDYRVLADFLADMRALERRFPGKARVFELPHRSHEGRVVHGIEICTDVERNDGRPVFYMDGIHHAREWPAAEMPIMWAFDLLESYDTDPRIRTVVDNVRTIIVPVMNPDGYHYSRSAYPDVQGAGNPITGNSYWRKNRRAEAHALDAVIPRFGAYGVDPNRNYTYGWGGSGSSASTTSDTYRGPTPLSEPENANVAAILRSHHAHAMITHHTSGRYVLWAWSWTMDDLAEQALVEGLGRAMAAHNGYRPQKSIQLYIHTGVCVDYAYGSFNSISYTFEHNTSFHPPYAANIPSTYAANRPAFLLLTEEACLPPQLRAPDRDLPAVLLSGGYDPDALNHGVLTGRLVDAEGNGVAGTVRLTKAFETPLWFDGDGNNPTGRGSIPEAIDTAIDTAADGTFTYHVNPSTRHHAKLQGLTEAYELTATGPGGTATRSVVVERGEVVELGNLVLGS